MVEFSDSVRYFISVAFGRRDMDYKSHSGATDGCQCEDRFVEGLLTLHLLSFPLIVSFFFSLYLLLTSHNQDFTEVNPPRVPNWR
jgi:hypothetical protein